jgi:hypothetical protein
LRGEKLSEEHVHDVVDAVLAARHEEPAFWMMAPEIPDHGNPFYSLFVQWSEGQTQTEIGKGVPLAEGIESGLYHNMQYGACRRLGQLDGISVFIIDPQTDPARIYRERCIVLGQRPSDVRPAALHPSTNWSYYFDGSFVSPPSDQTAVDHPAASASDGSQ